MIAKRRGAAVRGRERYARATGCKAKIAVRAEAVAPFDAADYLRSEKDVAAYLKACFEDGDPALIAAALGDIGRACFPARTNERVTSPRK